MKPTIAWLPVLQPLYMREYNPAITGDEHFLVCVNPKAELWNQRAAIMGEFRAKFEEYGKAIKQKDASAIESFEVWSNGEFSRRAMQWYADILSFGEEKYTVEELKAIEEIDLNLVNWLFSRIVGMIEDHRRAKKK